MNEKDFDTFFDELISTTKFFFTDLIFFLSVLCIVLSAREANVWKMILCCGVALQSGIAVIKQLFYVEDEE